MSASAPVRGGARAVVPVNTASSIGRSTVDSAVPPRTPAAHDSIRYRLAIRLAEFAERFPEWRRDLTFISACLRIDTSGTDFSL